VPDFNRLTRWDNREVQKALTKVASFYSVEPEMLVKKNRINRWQRDVAISVFQRYSRWSLVEMGKFFSVNNSAVCKAIARVDLSVGKNNKLRREMKGLYSTFNRVLKNRIFLAKAQRAQRNWCKFAEKICVYPCSSVVPCLFQQSVNA